MFWACRLKVQPSLSPFCYTQVCARLSALDRGAMWIAHVDQWRSGQVGEWLKPTDCKSVTPCELRRFESFPVHHLLSTI